METRQLDSVYMPLRLCYGLVPIAAGLDKFTNLLVDWKIYLPKFVSDLSPVGPSALMGIVGMIEIVAGIVVLAVLPRLGSLVVAIWLVLVGVMAALAGHPDVMVRDLVMAVGAYTLSMVAAMRGEALLPTKPAASGVRAHAIGH
jgi:uncharacterized membrane protein YphA (DoxX/SURF4 family)